MSESMYPPASTVWVELTVNGATTYGGDVDMDDVVHLALHQLLPPEILNNHRITVRKDGELIYPDMFLNEILAHYGDARFEVLAAKLNLQRVGNFTNYGFDHLALAFEDRSEAKRFFAQGLGLQVVRDDDHLTVVTSGATALFLFDFDPDAPLAPPAPSQIHHLGFVVDDLEEAAAHLNKNFPEFVGGFTLLERQERWSLYGEVQLGSINFLIQLSQIKEAYRGLTTPTPLAAQAELYDYASQDYGVRLG